MSEPVWTIRTTLNWTRGYLERKGDEHPRLSTEWLLSAATGLSRVELYTNFDKPLNAEERAKLHAGIERRAAGEPLQYVTGEMPFRHIVLACAPGVLIPRPETEVLVDEALAALGEPEGAKGSLSAGGAEDSLSVEPPNSSEGEPSEQENTVATPIDRRVLEIGTGTGCIALSIATERPGTQVVATDIAPAAIALATRNRDALALDDAVELIECDMAAGVDEELMGSFDVLVSNPPYIPTEVLAEQVPAEVVDFEPQLALDGGADGLDVFRRLLEVAPRALKPGGTLCVELYEGALDAAADLVRHELGWCEPRIVEDLTHRPRVLIVAREGGEQ